MNHPLLLELNTRCWLRELSTAAGVPLTLAAVPDSEFTRWRKLGFTHLWLMGVWTTGPRSRQVSLSSPSLQREFDRALPGWTEADVGGSPFAIAGYTVPGEIGGITGLQDFRHRLHQYGIKLVLDFIPNHFGLDHPWIKERPELFVQANEDHEGSIVGGRDGAPVYLCHGRDPNFDPWTDTVQLDHRREDTRACIIRQLLDVARECDGLRCDMAMLILSDVFAQTWSKYPCRGGPVPGEFWAEAIAAVRRTFPDFLFIAEAYWNRERDLLRLGFDYAYHKAVTDALSQAPDRLQATVIGASDWLPCGVHFLENHDENRAAARFSGASLGAAAFLILTLPGLRLLHDRQLEGWRVRVPVHLCRRGVEPTNPGILSRYDRLLATLAASDVCCGQCEVVPARPAWRENPTCTWFVLILWQHQPGEFHLAVVNLAPHRSQCYAPLNVAELAKSNWRLIDLFGDECHLRTGPELEAHGLYLDVTAYATQVFQFRPCSG
ncbi:MAG: alpha-amylase family glycosyl hydrolase [Verrucomicrobia bacterium]|nr:alpha-amylase family glycosyl hydrolase [Verrucomicrobiota bacterium]